MKLAYYYASFVENEQDDESYKKSVNALKRYVESAEPCINKYLRNCTDTCSLPDEVFYLDHLFNRMNSTSGHVYRGLPNDCVLFTDDIYVDKGYMSTSKSMSNALAFSKLSKHPALLIISFDNLRIIDVNKIISCNDEDEWLLPRGLSFRVSSSDRYFNKNDDKSLSLEAFESNHQDELTDSIKDIEELTVYAIELIDNPMRD